MAKGTKTLGKKWEMAADPVAAVKAWLALPEDDAEIAKVGDRVLLRMPDGTVNVVTLTVFAKVSVGDLLA